jgi:transcriptional regulator of acetoin/glycerol metabolism
LKLSAAPQVIRRAEGSDTMRAWERFLTGDPMAIAPVGHLVVSSWQRSLQLGVDPASRAAPLAVDGDAFAGLREQHGELLDAASHILAEAGELFAGSGSIMLLTNADGVVLETVGDMVTLEAGEGIHLIRGGDWRERVIGTNGIGTALATGRPAQVHASEHFCEGIKRWTCAAAPIFEPGTGTIVGLIDISGPPSTYQRNNLAMAVSTARQIEMVLAERTTLEKLRLLETCLRRLGTADASCVLALDRAGRLVHASGPTPAPVRLGERLPGINPGAAIEDWASQLPEGLRSEWFNPVTVRGRAVGAVIIVPRRGRSSTVSGSEADPERSAFGSIIGRSPAMAATLERARQLAKRRVPVLIEGETGVGKELLARAIHGDSDAGSPFIAFNCGAVPRELVAGELFGHVRGAFTGATTEGRAGRFELADRGTLCLDEIGEMPLELQPILLRALEEGVIYRLGDHAPRRVDVRLLGMTNRNLRAEVDAGRFRRDLYYRISVTNIRIPPLRERGDDIGLLVDHFNQRLAQRHGVATRHFGDEVLELLHAYAWPGNIRELRNVVEALLLVATEPEVRVDELPEEIRTAIATGPSPQAEAASASLDAIEHDAIARAMRTASGNVALAARALGVSRSTLYRKLERYRDGVVN